MTAAVTVDEYLAAVADESQRAALHELRAQLHEIVPDATETISYNIPTLKFEGKSLVGFGSTKGHCTFYLLSSSILDGFGNDLGGFKTGRGSIQFQPGQPLPETLVRRLVEARIEQNRHAR